ncbi:MAG: Ig-like domain-containing protein, partial [Candidatus Thorarchaeota archaeon]
NFTLEWDSDNSWEGALLNIPEDGLYDIRLDSYLSYNVSSGYAGPLDIHIPDKLIFLSKAKGALYASGLSNFIEYHPVHFVSIGSEADSYWFDEGMAAFQKGQYYVFGLSGIFEHLNSTSFNITIDVQPSVSLQLNANEPINLEFDALVPSTHLVAVILPDGNKSSLRFTNPSGGNWTVSTSFYPSMQPAAPSLTYLKYPEGEQTMEVRFDDIFVLTGIGVSVGTSFKAKQVTGEPWSVIYQPYGFTSSYTDGELTSYSMSYLYMTFPFPIFFFEVSAAPVAATYSETFNVTMCLDAVPFIELDETITTTSFNATHGPIIELYRFDVQSGHTYNISATPTEYTIEGTIVFAVLPSLSVFDQWSISYEPLLAKTVSDYPSYGYLAAQTTNRTASIEFLAAIDGEIQIYAAAGSGLSLGDCTEAEFEVEETPPTTIGFGDSVSLSTEETDLYGYQVELIEGYEYELTIQMSPSVGSVSATFFDTDGVNPFATTEEEIWLEVDSSTYLYKKFTLISHYTGIASLGLILEGDATLTWDVVDTTPPVLSIISPLDGSRFEPGTITIEFTADDNIELTQLNLTIGGSNIPLDLTATSYDWNAETEGVFVVKLTAEDTHGNTAGTHVVVIVALESYLSMEILVISGLGAFGGVLVIGIVVIRRRGGG